ncbi:MAG TPA: DUF1573 domain-containing protein [Pirellulales bacterium]|nr:DUF1573 domain-containing protein [Pirellulales bacterium]
MMIRRLILAFVIFTAQATLSCEPVAAQDWASKMFDKLEHDFGDVAKDAATEYRFQITNRYLEDMNISSVHASCGCTTPTITKNLLKSGEVAELIAQFNTDRFEGQHGATLTVRFAPPYAAEVRVQVKGYVRRDVVIVPGRIEFGSVDAEQGVEKKAKIYYAGRDAWQLVDVRSNNKDFKVELLETQRGNGNVVYELLFRLKKGAPPGYINDRLTLVTNDLRRTFVPLSVEGHVIASLSVSPQSLQMGAIRPGESVTRQIVVRGKDPFTITNITSASGNTAFSFATSDEPRKLHMIPITYTATDATGKVVDRIQITIDDGSRSIPDVVAHVEVADQP